MPLAEDDVETALQGHDESVAGSGLTCLPRPARREVVEPPHRSDPEREVNEFFERREVPARLGDLRERDDTALLEQA
jgi:hypothetical protein